MDLYFLIGALGVCTGFLSGMLGIGGGIVMAPLLLYVPPWFGFSPLPMRVVAGLTIVPSERKLYAATHGLSAWLLNLP